MPEYSEAEREQVRRAHENYMLPDVEPAKPLDVDDEKQVRAALKQRENALNEFDPNRPDERSPLHEVKGDQEARVEDAAADHEPVTNAELQLREPYTDERMTVVVAQNRAGVDRQPEDTTGVEDLEQEALVAEALREGRLYETGGPMGNYTGRESLSPYVDGAWLAEASKQTGEKFF
jgi:hypothetical protein